MEVVGTQEGDVLGNHEDEVEFNEPLGLVPCQINSTKWWFVHEMLILCDVKCKDLFARGKITSGKVFLEPMNNPRRLKKLYGMRGFKGLGKNVKTIEIS